MHLLTEETTVPQLMDLAERYHAGAGIKSKGGGSLGPIMNLISHVADRTHCPYL